MGSGAGLPRVSAVHRAVLWAGSQPRQSERVSGKLRSLANLSLQGPALVRKHAKSMPSPVALLFMMPSWPMIAGHVS